jgi:hypothetical protein
VAGDGPTFSGDSAAATADAFGAVAGALSRVGEVDAVVTDRGDEGDSAKQLGQSPA